MGLAPGLGVPSVVLSTGVVVGPGMRREVFIFKWLWNALHGLPIVVEGGRQTRDVTFIDDVVDAWVRAIHAPAEEVVGQKFYVGRGEEIAVEDLAVMCRDAAGAGVTIEYVGGVKVGRRRLKIGPSAAIHRFEVELMVVRWMYRVDVNLRVRRAVMVEGMSIREASRIFGLHRDTVRKMLAYSAPPGHRRQSPPRRPRLERASSTASWMMICPIRRGTPSATSARPRDHRRGGAEGPLLRPGLAPQ